MIPFPWLTGIVLFPVSAAIAIPFLPTLGNHTVKWYALGVCLLDFLMILYVFGSGYQFTAPQLQLGEDYAWLETIGFHWQLGVDGLSVSLLLLTAFVTTAATLAAWPVTRKPRLFYFLMLAMYSGQLGLFAAQDMLLFFLMWELELIPVYLLLSMWGGRQRLYAATKFLFYTAGGSVFLLAGVLTASLWGSSTATFAFQALYDKTYPKSVEILIYAGFLIAYAVKLPALPLHTWLPDTHGEAHYSTCMLLAGILLKMGGYGFLRVNVELLPHAHAIFAPWLAALGAAQIVYAALLSLAQRSLKRRIAYSSISHMGFVLLGVASLSNIGLSGAILQMLSHGLVGAALFFLAGTTYDRTRASLLCDMSAWAVTMPKMFVMFTACSMASLALPGMSGFVSELMVLLGMVTSSSYNLLAKTLVTVVAAAGTVFTPIYLLSMIRQLFYGSPVSAKTVGSLDATPREVFVLTSLLLPIIGIGLCPDLALLLWSERVQALSLSF